MTKRKLLLIIISIFVCVNLFSLWASTNWLKVNTFLCDRDKLPEELEIMVLSDLHEHEFGEDNEKLISKVEEQAPSLILILGDFINKDSEDTDRVFNLIQKMNKIAPVYFAWGNHELEYMDATGIDLQADLESTGAILLEKEFVDLEINGQEIRLGGMYGYAFKGGYVDAAYMEKVEFLREFQDTDRLKIMMCHRPDSFIFGDASEAWDVDLVVSGHNHGGQVVIPFLGGVVGMDQGYFPEYVHGMYEKDEMNIFVTSGLGTSWKMVPRWNNRPEVAVVKVK